MNIDASRSCHATISVDVTLPSDGPPRAGSVERHVKGWIRPIEIGVYHCGQVTALVLREPVTVRADYARAYGRAALAWDGDADPHVVGRSMPTGDDLEDRVFGEGREQQHIGFQIRVLGGEFRKIDFKA